MKRVILTLLIVVATTTIAHAQKSWTLKECIEYAIENNISVQSSEIDISQSEIELKMSKNNRLPNLYTSLGSSIYFGRGPSRDGTYIDNTQSSSSVGVSTSAPIYQGSQIKHDIKLKKLNIETMLQGQAKAKQDVALNVTALYLEVLFNKEILKIAEKQLLLSDTLVTKSEILFKNGKSSESELYESKALRANDELTVTQSRNNLQLSLVNLSQALNIENASGFDIAAPDSQEILSTEYLVSLRSATSTYDNAITTLPQILMQESQLKSMEQSLKVTRSALYPTISLSAGYSNSAYHSFLEGYENTRFKEQMKINGNETIGLSVQIPIFNRNATRNQILISQLSIKTQKLALINEKQQLSKEIEQAYYNADAARASYISSGESVKAAQKAFEYEKIKALAGQSTIFDFNDSRTRLESSESEMVRAKYEFIFRKKILEFYYNGDPQALYK